MAFSFVCYRVPLSVILTFLANDASVSFYFHDVMYVFDSEVYMSCDRYKSQMEVLGELENR